MYQYIYITLSLTKWSTSGFIYDASGSYSWAFYFGGIVILMAAATMSFMPCVLRYDARRGLYHLQPQPVNDRSGGHNEQTGQTEVFPN